MFQGVGGGWGGACCCTFVGHEGHRRTMRVQRIQRRCNSRHLQTPFLIGRFCGFTVDLEILFYNRLICGHWFCPVDLLWPVHAECRAEFAFVDAISCPPMACGSIGVPLLGRVFSGEVQGPGGTL